MRKILPLLFTGALLTGGAANAQLFISSGSTFVIQTGGVVTVQGDIVSSADITGGGTVLLKGTANQNLNTNGFTIPNLQMDNAANATLTGNTRIGNSLSFTNGKIVAGAFNVRMADVAAATGMGAGKFVETNAAGQVIKEISANLTSNEIPVGLGSIYRPAFITSAGTYSSATVGIRVLATASPNRPPSVSDYLNVYWPVTRNGITGSLTVGGQYDNSDLTVGTEANLRGYYYTATDWSSAGETHDAATNRVAALVTGATGDITGIDKFNLIRTQAFLQAAYTGSSLMADNLRTAPNLIPLSDPYRTAPYNANFTHTANPINETVTASVFADQTPATNNIVDWVFLELRNNSASPGNTILQTRSALLRRDGIITDVDGISPVTFNNIASGAYTVAVRHRNHLGISTDPATFTNAFADVKSTAPLVDFTSATDAQIFGNAFAFKINAADNKNLLWTGDAASNGTVKYSGTSTDPSVVLNQSLGFSGNTSSLYNYNNAIGYFSGDVNLDRKVKYSGTSNDPSLILSNVLVYPGNTSSLYNYNNFTRQLPN